MAKRVHYNKLIRDKIPDRLVKKGVDFKTRELDEGEFELELLKKVGEEASALPGASSRTEIIEELADVLDVIDEIKKRKGISEAELADVRRENFEKKGGFDKKVFLFWSEDDNYKTNERRNAR